MEFDLNNKSVNSAASIKLISLWYTLMIRSKSKVLPPKLAEWVKNVKAHKAEQLEQMRYLEK